MPAKGNRRVNPKEVQIIILSRDRVTPLCMLIEWLLEHGYKNLNILDNDSAYPPLLEYYEQLDGLVTIYRTGKNLLSKALWCWTEAWKVVKPPFVYTDNDVVPTEDCPDNLIEFLLDTAERYGYPNKVGMSLKIDDIPDHYSQAEKVRTWEAQNWARKLGTFRDVEMYAAGVDTTFALYPRFMPFSLSAIRVGEPYTARHMPWYMNSQNLTPEEQFYEDRAAKGCHTWGANTVYSRAVSKHYEKVKQNAK